MDVLASVLPVPDPAVMSAMLKREQKLRSSPGCQRAINMPLSSRQEINRQIRLRVVREFNLPDPVADMLENYHHLSLDLHDDERKYEGPIHSPEKSSLLCQGHMTFPRSNFTQRHELPAVVAEGEFRFPAEPESSSCSDGHLSDIMPDIAMATSTMGQMQLQDQQEMQLDLGDGASHLQPMASASYRRYQPSTYPHLRSETQPYLSPKNRFL